MMLRIALLFSSFLVASTTAKQQTGGNNNISNNNHINNPNKNNNGNGNTKKLGGFTSYLEEAPQDPITTGTVGQCTITTTTGKTCTEGIARSFTITDVYGTTLIYDCECPSNTCSSNNILTNAGVGSYKCTVTSENYVDGMCGDVDIASSIFTSLGCEMDNMEDGTMRCAEECYCDPTLHICTSEGEECCAGSCQKVMGGPGVKGRWELQCLAEGSSSTSEEEEVAKKNVMKGGAATDQLEEAA